MSVLGTGPGAWEVRSPLGLGLCTLRFVWKSKTSVKDSKWPQRTKKKTQLPHTNWPKTAEKLPKWWDEKNNSSNRQKLPQRKNDQKVTFHNQKWSQTHKKWLEIDTVWPQPTWWLHLESFSVSLSLEVLYRRVGGQLFHVCASFSHSPYMLATQNKMSMLVDL